MLGLLSAQNDQSLMSPQFAQQEREARSGLSSLLANRPNSLSMDLSADAASYPTFATSREVAVNWREYYEIFRTKIFFNLTHDLEGYYVCNIYCLPFLKSCFDFIVSGKILKLIFSLCLL